MANVVVESLPHFLLFASTNVSSSKEEDEANIVGTDEKRLKFYSPSHQILLVGEGDFSFSLCLAKAFCSASNMLATSLDSYDCLIAKYKNAKPNLEQLANLGASLLHGLDATKMKSHTHLRRRKFDRIIFNFPHAGFHGREDEILVIEMHRNLVNGFLSNARGMLRAGGEIHVNHKITAPFCHWNLQELAEKNYLTVTAYNDFRIEDYPGYSNKRGSGSRCDESFPLGPCRTFKFIVSPNAKKLKDGKPADSAPQVLGVTPLHLQMQPRSFQWQPQIASVDNRLELTGVAFQDNFIRSECHVVFDEYLKYVSLTFGEVDHRVSDNVHEALSLGFQRYKARHSDRAMRGYIDILQELRLLSISRSRDLQDMLAKQHS